MAIKTDTFTGGGGGGAVDSVNGQTGVVVVSGNDIAADHSASNYTAANANIDGHLSGIDTKLGTLTTGLTYQGAFNATTGAPSIANASQGDLYVISVAGTIYGQTWAVGDHLLINADMGGSVDNAKIDKIDNTDQVTSVNTQTGAVVLSGNDLAADHSASNYTAANANIDGHLSGIDTKFGTLGTASTAASTSFLQVVNNLGDITSATTARGHLGLGTAATSASTDFLASTAGLDDLSDVSYTAGVDIDNYVLTYDHSTTSWGAEAAASGGLSEIVQDTTPQLGGDLDVNGNSITSAGNANVLINPAGTGDISIGADLIPDADATHSIGDEDNRYISTYSDLNGAIRFKAKNDEGSAITAGQALYIKGLAGDGTTPTVGLADADDAAKMPAFGLAFAGANDQAEVQIVSFGNLNGLNTSTFSVGDTLYISTTAGALVNTPPAGETALIQNIGRVVRSNNGAGVIKVGGAGRSAATPNLDSGKIFLGNGSNQAVSTALSSINVSTFTNDAGYLTAISGQSINDLSDVTITGAANGEYLRYNGSAWVDAALSISDDTSPQLSAALDVNGQDIISVSNGDIEVDPNGTGSFKIRGNATSGSGRIVLNCEQNTHGITLKGPPHSAAASYTLTFPNTDGTANQVLKTDGSGGLDWVDQASGGGGWTYSAITADPANAQASYHYSCTGTFTITLPTSGVSAGAEIRVKNMGTGTVTIDPQTQTIDGSTTDYVMDVQSSAITLVSTGTNWEII